MNLNYKIKYTNLYGGAFFRTCDINTCINVCYLYYICLVKLSLDLVWTYNTLCTLDLINYYFYEKNLVQIGVVESSQGQSPSLDLFRVKTINKQATSLQRSICVGSKLCPKWWTNLIFSCQLCYSNMRFSFFKFK